MKRTALSFAFLFASAPVLAGSWTDLWLTPDQQGQRMLDGGDAGKAAQQFQDPRLRAYADLKAGNYDSAAKQLAPLKDTESLYNRGNALARAGKLKDALAAYDGALAKSPNNRDARHNRELVERQLQKQAQQNGQQGKGQAGDKRQQGSNGQSGSSGQQQNGSQQNGGQQGQQQNGSQQNGGQQGQQQNGSQQNGDQQGQQQNDSQQNGGQQGQQQNGSQQNGGQQGQQQNGSQQNGGQQGQQQNGSQQSSGQQGQQQNGSQQHGGQQGQQQNDSQHSGGQQGQEQSAQSGQSGQAPNPPQQGAHAQGSGASRAGEDDLTSAGAPTNEQRAAAARRDAQAAFQHDNPQPAHVAGAEENQKPTSEQALAREQWLRRIPEDPGELLRRKFMVEYMKKKRDSTQ